MTIFKSENTTAKTDRVCRRRGSGIGELYLWDLVAKVAARDSVDVNDDVRETRQCFTSELKPIKHVLEHESRDEDKRNIVYQINETLPRRVTRPALLILQVGVRYGVGASLCDGGA